ncbi:MAG: class I SAM-dependent methyltransferase [Acidimicrobiaceae bacterium]|nr:class I SAM-dependent methyltransferase [Acidimicrobiaceae bacterium]
MSSEQQADTSEAAGGDQAQTKRTGELAYWSERKDAEGALKNSWFERFYTDHFGLTRDDYSDKRVLDIGCGPRGSLEWAAMARERVGVDPLADDYSRMGAADHAMTYVAAGAESIPFEDQSFDIVCSFNSLDHVDDLEATIAEMKRLTAVGGLLLVITDVHDRPTPQEPICFDWNLVELFAPEFALQSLRCHEKQGGGAYQSAEQSVFFNHADARQRYGVLSARFMRVADPETDAPRDGIAEEVSAADVAEETPQTPDDADSTVGRLLTGLGERASANSRIKDAEAIAGRLLGGLRTRVQASVDGLSQRVPGRGGRHRRR